MAGLTSKDKETLAYFYETEQYKALEKYCQVKRLAYAELLLQQDMSAVGADKIVAMLQGQVYAMDYMLKEIKSIHSQQQKLKG